MNPGKPTRTLSGIFLPTLLSRALTTLDQVGIQVAAGSGYLIRNAIGKVRRRGVERSRDSGRKGLG